ncbi:hypothetical protein HY989_05225 [Candidatus Micrarchaeota archaeon]|nr:hypothetical protein [Candidatus Micrarchaeota archaeon]
MLDISLIYEFVIIASAVSLFIHLVFGRGEFKDAAIFVIVAWFLLNFSTLLSVYPAAVFIGLLGLMGMAIYKIDLLSTIGFIATLVIASIIIFPG